MNKQRGSSSDLAEVRIQWLAPNAVRVMRTAGSPPPDRPWLRHVLFPVDPKGLRDPSGLDVDVREGIVHVQARDDAPLHDAPLSPSGCSGAGHLRQMLIEKSLNRLLPVMFWHPARLILLSG